MQDLQDGYRRHLEWHRGAGDPWTWHGWVIVSGDRFGTLVDATFDHPPTDFDEPVDPAGDRADNMKNTVPHALALESSFIRRRGDLGGGDVALDSRLLQVWDVRVGIAGIEAFEGALREVAAASPREAFAWFQFVNGGDVGRYLLVAPAGRPSAIDFGTVKPLPPSLYPEIPDRARESIRSSIQSIRSELFAYQPALSYVPETK